jgi:hypothetical protein
LRCNRKRDLTAKDEPRLRVNDEGRLGRRRPEDRGGLDDPAGLAIDFDDVAEVGLDEMNENGDDPHQIGETVAIRVDRPGSPVEFGTSGAH